VAPAPAPDAIELLVDEIKPDVVEEGPLDLDQSIFKERRQEADARSYRCRGQALMRRAFEIDWSRATLILTLAPTLALTLTPTLTLILTLTLTRSRCNTERFRNFVRREDDATGDCELDEEMAELKTALKEKCGLIYSVYAYYCAIGNTADRCVMRLPAFQPQP